MGAGADVNRTDDAGETPLHAAARTGCRWWCGGAVVLMALLVPGAQVDKMNHAMSIATEKGHIEMVRTLVGAGAGAAARALAGAAAAVAAAGLAGPARAAGAGGARAAGAGAGRRRM